MHLHMYKRMDLCIYMYWLVCVCAIQIRVYGIADTNFVAAKVSTFEWHIIYVISATVAIWLWLHTYVHTYICGCVRASMCDICLHKTAVLLEGIFVCMFE